MEKNYPYAKHQLLEEDNCAVLESLKSGWLSQGPALQRFEQKIRQTLVNEYTLALSSGTAALCMAAMALDVRPGSRVWATALSFVATTNSMLSLGATVEFVDIDLTTFNIDIALLEQKLRQADYDGLLPHAVVVVHFAGLSVDMDRIFELGRCYGFKIIEDACHALGGFYNNRPVGSCEYSDIACFSLHPVKPVTAGEGGIISCTSAAIFERLQQIRSHGIVRDINPLEPWRAEMLTFGLNFRITEMQSALGESQFERLHVNREYRAGLARRYRHELGKRMPDLHFQSDGAKAVSAQHLFVIRSNVFRCAQKKLEFYQKMRAAGINLMVNYLPIPAHQYYRQLGYAAEKFPKAMDYYATAFSLPLYSDLQQSEQEYIINAFVKNYPGQTEAI